LGKTYTNVGKDFSVHGRELLVYRVSDAIMLSHWEGGNHNYPQIWLGGGPQCMKRRALSYFKACFFEVVSQLLHIIQH